MAPGSCRVEEASVLEKAFWILLTIGIYPYLIYPICIWLISIVAGRRPPLTRSRVPQSVTIIIAAYNEAQHIRQTVINKLALRSHGGTMSVIVVSDGSDDGTDKIVESIALSDLRVRLLRQPVRQGKTAALNLACAVAKSEILMFADANSIYHPDALARIVERFTDSAVGYVTGSMRYVNADGSITGDGCSAYMRYENFLRQCESAIGSVVGVDGGIDAVRSELYRPMEPDQLPDFVLPLQVVEQGFRVVYEPDAILQEDALTSLGDELRMRVRVALRAYWAIWQKMALLNPMRFPLFSWQFLSHKVLRYLSFGPLAAAATINVALMWRSPPYLVCAAVQLLFWAAVIGTFFSRYIAVNPLAKYCRYFFLLNQASAIAFGKFIAGRKQVLWQPRRG